MICLINRQCCLKNKPNKMKRNPVNYTNYALYRNGIIVKAFQTVKNNLHCALNGKI